MWKLTVVIAVSVAVAAAAMSLPDRKMADLEFLKKEKAVLQLLMHVHQPLLHPTLIEIANTWDVMENMALYKDKESVTKFWKMWKNDMLLKRGEIFNMLDDEHMKQAIPLFDLFYFAKDWDTMYKTAVWARQNANEEMFVYSYLTALKLRLDIQQMVLPPLYEIMPEMYLRTDVIQRAYETRMKVIEKVEKDLVLIPTNATTWFHSRMTPEKRMSYLTEDPALNEWNMEIHMEYPWWFAADSKYDNTDNRRPVDVSYYHYVKHLLAKYRLERLSNNLEDIEKFKWDEEMIGYAPHLRYKNGKEMSMRPDNMHLVDTEDIEKDSMKQWETKIIMLINEMLYKNNRRIDINIDAKEEIGKTMFRDLLNGEKRPFINNLLSLVGRIADPKLKLDLAPSAIMNWQTMLRDPLFYKILLRTEEIFEKYLNNFPSYTKEELFAPGMKIKSLDFDKLTTYFETIDMEMNNILDINTLDDDKRMTVIANHNRINHKPFNWHMVVNSDKETKAVVMVFVGPKYDGNGVELTLEEKAPLMFEIDRFVEVFPVGEKKIERNSKDSTLYFKEDKLSFRTLYKKIEDAIQNKAPFYIDDKSLMGKLPANIMLPKGKKNGMPYTMFVAIVPMDSAIMKMGKKDIEGFSLNSYGFPFDRRVISKEFLVPNMMEKDVIIYHKKTDEIHESI